MLVHTTFFPVVGTILIMLLSLSERCTLLYLLTTSLAMTESYKISCLVLETNSLVFFENSNIQMMAGKYLHSRSVT